ncbi:hypothetical protein NFI96_031087, partial [Prochilodus magdalenae]
MQVWLCLLFVLHVAEGCTLEDHQQRKEITAYTGESVLLPSYCTDLQSNPETFTWNKLNRHEEISSESGQYRNRVQLFNDSSPGNLSLLISHLTEEDGGLYRCKVDGSGFTDISLTVKEALVPGSSLSPEAVTPTPSPKPHTTIYLKTSAEPSTTISSQKEPPQSLPFIPFALVTLIFLHIVVAVVYCTKRTKGCTLEDHQQRKGITAYTGGSVLLPCYCTDPQSRPEKFRWKKYSTNTQRWEELSSESDQYRNRVQLVNDHSPGNLSLLIPHPTEEDGGAYRCTVDGSGFTYRSPQTPQTHCVKIQTKPFDRFVSYQFTLYDSQGNYNFRLLQMALHKEGRAIKDLREPPQSLPFIPFALVTLIFLHIVVAVVYCTKRTK